MIMNSNSGTRQMFKKNASSYIFFIVVNAQDLTWSVFKMMEVAITISIMIMIAPVFLRIQILRWRDIGAPMKILKIPLNRGAIKMARTKYFTRLVTRGSNAWPSLFFW